MKTIQCFAAFIPLLQIFLPASAYTADRVVFEGGKGPGNGKQIVFLSGDEEYRSEEGLPMLAKILAERHGFKCDANFDEALQRTVEWYVKNQPWWRAILERGYVTKRVGLSP